MAQTDRERILQIAEEFGSVKKIPANQIVSKSADGKTVITVDGTKVSDDLIAQTVREDKARAAGAAVAASAPEGLSREQVQAMVDEAVAKALGGNK